MNWTWTAGHVGGIPIRIHWTLLLFLGLVMLSGLAAMPADPRGELLRLLVFVGLFVTILLHELGHAVVGHRFGARVVDVILTPLGGMARMKRMPEAATPSALVAIAGPAVNFVLLLVLLVILGDPTPVWRVVNDTFTATFSNSAAIDPGSPLVSPRTAGDVLAIIAAINLVLGTFNLLPGFPMDGGRVLRALLTPRLGYEQATELAVQVGRTVALVFLLFGIYSAIEHGSFGGIILVVISLFLMLIATVEHRRVQRRGLLRNMTAADVQMPHAPVVGPSASVAECQSVAGTRQAPAAVVVDETGYLVGVCGPWNIAPVPPQMADQVSVREVMQARYPWVRPGDPLFRVIERMEEEGLRFVPVVEPDGRFRGLITQVSLIDAVRRRLVSEGRVSAG